MKFLGRNALFYSFSLLYLVDDRRAHLEAYEKSFSQEAQMRAFEYTYTHNQRVEKAILHLQLEGFLAGNPIEEDVVYRQRLSSPKR